MKVIILLIMVSFLVSCSTSKEYVFDNKKVTERAFKRKMDRYTKNFVKNMTQDQLDVFSNLEIVYDTTKH